MPKVSVVVPVYNVENYIERCARSLFEQTLDDMEFVFVDDCTPDNSMQVLKSVLEEYPHRKKQTKLFYNEVNKGSAITREVGIMASTGDYLAFCDSDDWVDVKMYETMFNKAEESGADCIISDFFFSNETGDRFCKGCDYVSKELIIERMLSGGQYVWALWNKLYRRKLFEKDITFPKCSLGEDLLLVLQLLVYSNKVAYLEEPLYHYFWNSSSITHSYSTEEKRIKSFLQVKDNILKLEQFFRRTYWNPIIRRSVKKLKIDHLLVFMPAHHEKEFRRVWGQSFNDTITFVPFYSDKTSKEKKKLIKRKLCYLLLGL